MSRGRADSTASCSPRRRSRAGAVQLWINRRRGFSSSKRGIRGNSAARAIVRAVEPWRNNSPPSATVPQACVQQADSSILERFASRTSPRAHRTCGPRHGTLRTPLSATRRCRRQHDQKHATQPSCHAAPSSQDFAPWACSAFSIFAQVSRSVTVRLKTGRPAARVGIDAEIAQPLELEVARPASASRQARLDAGSLQTSSDFGFRFAAKSCPFRHVVGVRPA